MFQPLLLFPFHPLCHSNDPEHRNLALRLPTPAPVYVSSTHAGCGRRPKLAFSSSTSVLFLSLPGATTHLPVTLTSSLLFAPSRRSTPNFLPTSSPTELMSATLHFTISTSLPSLLFSLSEQREHAGYRAILGKKPVLWYESWILGIFYYLLYTSPFSTTALSGIGKTDIVFNVFLKRPLVETLGIGTVFRLFGRAVGPLLVRTRVIKYSVTSS
ncbi:hypothetical protein B0F90DRAFT_316663 [Multifurca ochricompacta]|uniref:Uncharacterized protein n=1 Tax=Multifurca ochricompacta TaxID=376703 RepID=A0AAD4M4X3_9AGAM|nr:hypothetical protein B0F90DRAFT_316663 [Multifurca ochricompacta]